MTSTVSITLDELLQWYSRELPPAPCDCVEMIGGYRHASCNCHNYDDAKEMAVWCELANAEPRRIATLNYLKQLEAGK